MASLLGKLLDSPACLHQFRTYKRLTWPHKQSAGCLLTKGQAHILFLQTLLAKVQAPALLAHQLIEGEGLCQLKLVEIGSE